MCIVLVTTAHPSYALIIIDNRDEFILRPTSRPHWWDCRGQEVLSARDQQRAEQGTWLGVTKTGKFAVLTNFRETDTHNAQHPVQGERSRGGMVTAWLGGSDNESTVNFVHRLLSEDGVKGVGGFSLICGRLRKQKQDVGQNLESLAIISNRCEDSTDVPWIAGQRDEVYGLSNTSYLDPMVWPKVVTGKKLLTDVVNDAIAGGWDEERLVESLHSVLSTDDLPAQDGQAFEDFLPNLKYSIFIPPIGSVEAVKPPPKAEDIASAGEAGAANITNGHEKLISVAEAELEQEERPDPRTDNVMTGRYGTQRQTILLVDWDGNVTYRERSLYDEYGRPIPKGKGDMKFEFKITGWNDDCIGQRYPREARI